MTLPAFLGIPRVTLISCRMKASSLSIPYPSEAPQVYSNEADANSALHGWTELSGNQGSLESFDDGGEIILGGTLASSPVQHYQVVVFARQPLADGKFKVYSWFVQNYDSKIDLASGEVKITPADAGHLNRDQSSGVFSNALFDGYRRISFMHGSGTNRGRKFVNHCDGLPLSTNNVLDTSNTDLEYRNINLDSCAAACNLRPLCTMFDYNNHATASSRTCKLFYRAGINMSALHLAFPTDTNNRRSCWAKKELITVSNDLNKCGKPESGLDVNTSTAKMEWTKESRGCAAQPIITCMAGSFKHTDNKCYFSTSVNPSANGTCPAGLFGVELFKINGKCHGLGVQNP